MSNSKMEILLDVLQELKFKIKYVRGVSYFEILLNLYFDLGGRLPLSSKKIFRTPKYEIVEVQEILYILLIEKIQYMIKVENFNEQLLINMITLRIGELLETGYKRLLTVETRKGAKGYIVSKNATVQDIRSGYEIQTWWKIVENKLVKQQSKIITTEYEHLYYTLCAKEDYGFLED